MDRRTYIAVVGTGAIAGCLGGDEEVEADESDEADNDSESASDDRELPPVEQAGGDDSGNDVDDSASEAEAETEDDRQQTTDELELERAIERAENEYRLAMDEFASDVDGDDPSFIDVLPSTDLEFNNAREHLNAAREILWYEAWEFAHTDAERQRVREYRTYDDLITKLYRIQRTIHRSYTHITYPDAGGSYSSLPSSLTTGRDRHTDLGEEMADKAIYMSGLQQKYDQQAGQLRLLERTFGGLVNVRSTDRISRRSTTQLQFARDEFRTVITELENPSAALPDGRTDRAFLDVVKAWHTIVDETLQDRSEEIQ